MQLKRMMDKDVFTASKERMSYIFANFERIYVSFSGGKDSTVLLHLAMDEAKVWGRKIGVLLIDFEAQYRHTVEHARKMFDLYEDYIDLHWVCLPMKLRNAVSTFEPTWTAWDPNRKKDWVRTMPDRIGVVKDPDQYPFFVPGMEFEEFVVLWGDWYSQGKLTAGLVGIRADESLNRFRTICQVDKETFHGKRWTSRIVGDLYNAYPIYDWKTKDVWAYHVKTGRSYNKIYDLMHRAGLPLGKQRLCQPYGDDQRRGLWLYHVLEPETWYKVVNRVNGANSGSIYITETGNINGYNKITKPEGHTWRSFCNLLLCTLPKVSRDHYVERFRRHLQGWKSRGYVDGIPDEAPAELENKYWAPSWRRLCKVLLRNDWWCKGLGMQQPKSEAYGKYLEIKRNRQRKGRLNIHDG